MQAVETNNAPAALGPYSQGVKHGEYLFISGQVPLDAQTGELVSSDIAEQTRQVMQNLLAVAAAAGLNQEHLIKLTIYITDITQFSIVNETYGEYLGEVKPARATVEVAKLPKGASIEIEAIAAL